MLNPQKIFRHSEHPRVPDSDWWVSWGLRITQRGSVVTDIAQRGGAASLLCSRASCSLSFGVLLFISSLFLFPVWMNRAIFSGKKLQYR